MIDLNRHAYIFPSEKRKEKRGSGRPGMMARILPWLTLMLLLAGYASAVTRTWTGGGADDNWSTGGNWGGTAPAAGDDLVFSGFTRLSPINNMTGGTSFNSITFSGGAGPFSITGNAFVLAGGSTAIACNISSGSVSIANNITFTTAAPTITTIAGGMLTLGGSLSSGGFTLTVASSGNTQINGAIGGSGSLTKTGNGNLMLSGTNSYSGSTTISAGVLSLNNGSALGTTGSGTSVSAGASLDLNGLNYSSAEPLTLNGLGPGNIGALINSNSTAATFAGLITLGSNSSIIGQSGDITLSNTGTITGSGFNLILGGTVGGTLASILGTGTGGLTKQDAGAWTLSGANTYTGPTNISAGALKLNNTSALGTTAGGTTVSSGALLDLNGLNYVSAEPLTLNGTGISNSGALVNSSATGATFGGLITLGSASSIIGQSGTINIANTGTMVGASYGLTLGGAQGGSFASIFGGGSGILTKVGAGTWTFSGSNSQALNSLTLSAGTLNLGSGLTHSVASTLSISGGTLDFGSSTLQVAGSSVDFSSLGSLTAGTGTLAFTSSTAQAFIPLSGSTFPAITKSGAGTVTLNSGLAASSLAMGGGTWDWSSYTHTLGAITSTGGTMAFNTATVKVSGNCNLSGLASVTNTSAHLEFNGSSAQTFTPKSAATHPAIDKTGSGTITLGGAVTMGALSVSGGTWNWPGGISIMPSLTTTGGITMGFGSGTVRITAGDCDLSGVGSLTTGSSGLDFRGSGTQILKPAPGIENPAVYHFGTGTVRLAGSDLTTQTLSVTGGGTFDNSTNALTVTVLGTLTVDNSGYLLSTNGPLYAKDVSLAAGTIDCPGSGVAFNVSGDFTEGSSMTWNTNSGTITMNGGGTHHWISAYHSFNNLTFIGSGSSWTVNAADLTATGTMTLTNGSLDLASQNASTGDLTLNGGSLTATNNNLDINGAFLMSSGTLSAPVSGKTFTVAGSFTQSGGTLTPGTGAITLDGNLTGRAFRATSSLNKLSITGGGVWTITNSGLTTDKLDMSAGTLNLGTSLVHAVASTFSLSGGSLNFGSSTLKVAAAAVDFSALATLTPGTGLLELNGTSLQTLTPKNGVTLSAIKQNGSGGTVIATNPMNTDAFTLAAGNLDLGSSYTHVGNITITGGSLNIGYGGLYVSGATVDFSSISALDIGTGSLVFEGSSAQTFTPKSGLPFPYVYQNGTGTTTITGNSLLAASLVITNGGFNLGSGLSHSVGYLNGSSGALNFGSSTLHVTTGNVSLSGLSTLTPGTGTLAFDASSGTQVLTPKSGATQPFITHGGAGTLQLATYPLSCLGFSQSNGTLDMNSMNITTTNSGNFTVTNGTSSSFTGLASRTLTVAGNASFTGTSAANKVNLNPGAAWYLTVAGTLTGAKASLANNTATVSGGSGTGACSDCANGGVNTGWDFATTWVGAGANDNWTTIANWGSGSVPTAADNVTFDATSVRDAFLDAASSVKSITFTSGYTGTFNLSTNTLSINGNADFRSGGAFNPFSGTLAFTGSSAQNYYPSPSGEKVASIVQNGAGGTTILGSAGMVAGSLVLTSGTLNLGTALGHNVTSISGSGGLDFGGSGTAVYADGNVNISGLTVTASNLNYLIFSGTSAQTFTPKASVTNLNIYQDGTGGTTVQSYGFTASKLKIANGTLNLGTGLTHLVTTTLQITGGGLAFGSSTLQVQPTSVDLTALTSITPGTGTLAFTGSSAQTFTPKASATHPNIKQYGTGGTTVVTNNLVAGALTLNQGTFNLGTALSHSFTTVSDGGGGPYGNLNFNSSQLHVTGNVQIGNVPTLTAGSGSLNFDAASGTQVFVPKSSGATHPAIFHAGAGTLQLATYNLTCLSFTQSGGALDFNGKSLTTISSGNLSITNGTSSTMVGLSGTTINVAGSASFSGTSGANRINLNPGAVWSLNVTGSLTASLASLDYSNASGSTSAGTCTNCADGGNNTNWTSAVSWIGGGGNSNWTTAANWGSGSIPTTADNVIFNATNANATLDAAASIKSLTITSGYTGAFNFSSNTLTINSGDADFRTGGTIAAGTGALVFTGSSAQTFIPKTGAVFPDITQNGSGTTTVSTNSFNGGNLTLSSGTFNLGSGLNHAVKAISGSATLDFGSSQISANGNVDLSSLTVSLGASNTLAFGSSTSQTFTPNASVTALKLSFIGTGTTTVLGNGFTTPVLFLNGGSTGILNLGSGLTHTVTTTLTVSSGGLDFASSTLKIGAASVDMSALVNLTPGTGFLEFSGSAAQTFTPKSGGAYPGITQNGSGGTTIASNNLAMGNLSIVYGTFHLGSGLTHTAGDISSTGGTGGLDFGSSTLKAGGASVGLAGLGTLTPGTGTLELTNSSALSLTPKSGTTHPNIKLSGAGTVALATNNLTAGNVDVTAGNLDLTTKALTVGGNLTVSGGTLTANNGALDVNGDVSATSGSLVCPGSGNSFTVSGSFTVAPAVTLAHYSGTITLDGTATGKTLDIGPVIYNLTLNGSGGEWTVVNHPIWIEGMAALNAGSLKLGTGLTHTAGYLTSSGADLNFGSSTLRILYGDADFSGLGTMTPGTGALAFISTIATQTLTPKAGITYPAISHSGTTSLRLYGNPLSCASFSQSGGNLDLNGLDLTTTGNFSVTNGSSTSFSGLSGRTLTVAGNVSLNGTPGTGKINLDPGTAWTLAVSGTLNANYASLANSNASTTAGTCTNCSNAGGNTNWGTSVVWNGSVGDGLWSTPGNWGSDAVPTSGDNVAFNATAAGATLDAAATITSITMTTGYTGAFSFGANTLTINGGDADFRSGGSVSGGTGTLAFTSASAQKLYPKSGATMPSILQNGSGGTTIMANALANAGSLTVTSGTFNLGESFSHTVGSISGSGGLDFGTSDLNTNGNAAMSGLTVTAASSNTLAFTGSNTHAFTPSASLTTLNLRQNGSGTTTVQNYSFTAPTLTMTTGTLALGTGLDHFVTTLSLNGGGLDFGSSSLSVSGATVNFANLATLNAGTGTLAFTGTSSQTFTPKTGFTFPTIRQNGSGGTGIATNDLSATAISISAGSLDLGARTVTAGSLSSSGGGISFSNGTLHITTGNAAFGSMISMSAGSGFLSFDATTGTQVLTPMASATLPHITHAGGASGILQISTRLLKCYSYTQTGGTLDLNGNDLQTTFTGLTVTNGNSSSFTGLGGRTLTVAGNASISGTNAATKVGLNPGSPWNLAVTGTLNASFADLSNNTASVSAGTCTNCAASSNTNWGSSITWNSDGTDALWNNAANWGSNSVPTSTDAVIFDATSVHDATVNVDASVKSITLLSAYTGTFAFGSTRKISIATGNADFRSGGTVTGGTGGLVFQSATAQTFYPKSGMTLGTITQDGTGTTTVSGNPMQTSGNLVLNAGTFNLGASLSHTVDGVTGSGNLDFATSNLNATGLVNFAGLNSITASASNTLAFTGTSAQTYTPKASVTALNLKQNGTGGTTILFYGFTAPTLTLSSGTLALGAGLTHSVTAAMSITGGALNFSTSTLKSAAPTIDLRSLASITAGSGVFELNGASAQTLIPHASATLPALVQSGAGGTAITTNALNAGALTISNGTLNLSSGLGHTVASLNASGGGLTFNNSFLSIAGDANLSGLATLTPGTGKIYLTGTSGDQFLTPKNGATHPGIDHAAAGTLDLAGNLICNSFLQSAGTLNLNGSNITTVSGGDMTFNNGTSSSFANLGGRTLTVAGNASFNGQSGNLANMDAGSDWTLAVTGTLNANYINLAHCQATVAAGTANNSADGGSNANWTFGVTWTGAGINTNWTTGTNWSSGIAPGATVAVTFDGTSVKDVLLDADASAKSITFTSAYTGTLDFSSRTLTIAAGNADFRSGGAFAPGTGILAFVGTSAQTFFPKSGAAFPNITQNGSGTTTVSGASLSAKNLLLSAGTFNLGSGFAHVVQNVSGSGALNFGTSDLKALGDVDLSGMTVTAASSNTLTFSGSSAQTYNPKATLTTLNLKQDGTGGTTVVTNNFYAPVVSLITGTLNLGAGRTHTVGTTFNGTGGGLNFASSVLNVGAAVLDFTSLGSLTPGTGKICFNSGSAQTFVPKASTLHPDISQTGTGTTTITTNGLNCGAVSLTKGTLNLGTGLVHTATSVSEVSTTTIDFNSSTLQVSGDVNLGSLTTLVPGTGSLIFTAASGTQILTPKPASTHPFIQHSGAGTLQLAAQDLTCASFSQSAGTLDLNGRNLTTVSSGNFSISNGTTTSFANLNGRTITVAGNTQITGQSGNLVDMNPAAWTLAATGTVDVHFATVANCNATISDGVATNSVDGGGNTKWAFPVTWTGAGGNPNWSNPANWASGAIPTATTDVRFDATSVLDAALDVDASARSISFNGGYTGTFSFTTHTLSLNAGSSNFIGGETLAAGMGALAFVGTSPKFLAPKSGAVFPNIIQNGTGTTTIVSNPIIAGDLTVTAGTFNLGSSSTQTFKNVSGSGTLDFSSCHLNAKGDVDLSGMTVATVGTNLIMSGSVPQTYKPNASVTNLGLTQSGTGGTTIQTNGFTVPALTLSAGTLKLGTALIHKVTSTLSMTGGSLDFGSATLKVASASADFTLLGSLVAGTGTLEFNGAAAQTFKPKASLTYPALTQNGAGGTSVITAAFNSGALNILDGAFALGTGLLHTAASVNSGATGALNFNSSTLKVTGSANLSGLASISAGTGTLSFIGASGTQDFSPRPGSTHPAVTHSGAGTLRLVANPLICASFSQSAGTLDLNGNDLTTAGSGNFTLTNGTTSSFAGLGGRTLTVGGNTSITGQAGNLVNLDAAAWVLASTGALTANYATLANANASVAVGTASNSADAGGNAHWNFSVTWVCSGSDHNWSTAANWSSGIAPTIGQTVLFNSSSSADVLLDADVSIKAFAFVSGFTGNLDFGSHTLTVNAGDADFRGGETIAPGTGALAFTSNSSQSLYAKSGTTLPDLRLLGTGGVTLSLPTVAGNVVATPGVLSLGSGALTHTIKSVSGTGGGVDFGNSTLNVTGDADLSGLSGTVPSGGTMAFIGSSPQTYTPHASIASPTLYQTGTGGTTIAGHGFLTPNLYLTNGTLNLGAGLTNYVTNSVHITGGNLNFSTSTLSLATVTADFTSLNVLTAGAGTLAFTGGSSQTFIPKVGGVYPDILQTGAGGTTISTNPLIAGALSIGGGTLHLGSSLSHTFTSVIASAGGLDFGSSSLEVKNGNANLVNLATLTAGTGQLKFTATSGTQILSPKNGATHPQIIHSGLGTLALAANTLLCAAFDQLAGILDFNGFNIGVRGTGGFSILNGGSGTLANLGGRTVTVGGNATLQGQPANHLDLNPASGWTMAVSGTLNAVNSDIKNSLASVSVGHADSSANLLGNTNWTFLDSLKPDDVTAFTATALGGNAVVMTWSAPTAADADSILIRARTDGTYPTSQTDGTLFHEIKANRTADTVSGIPDKTIYQLAAFVKDSSGNWSPASASAQDSARVPDITPPANVTAFTATAIGPFASALSWIKSGTADADTTMLRYRTDGAFPTSATDGTLWKKVRTAAVSDTATGLAANTVYAFAAFVRDSSGNYSPAAAGAKDTALYQNAVTGAVVINDANGLTRDPDPKLIFDYADADSMRFSLLADTAQAAWKTLRGVDSVTMAAGADGQRIILAQYKNAFGTRSPWYGDTTLLDRTAPVTSLNLIANYSYKNWPAAISGKALDAVAGTDSIFVLRIRESDGAYYNGATWSATADTARLRSDSAFSMPMPSSALVTGFYQFSVVAKDKLGNTAAPLTMRVHYDENRAPALASSNIPDTLLQNQAVALTVDLGDPDLGDSVLTVSSTIPAWLTLTEKADTSSGAFAAHRIYTLSGNPGQAQVGSNPISIQARDLGGKPFTFAKTLIIKDVNDAPVFADGQDTLGVKEDSTTRWIPKYTDADSKDLHSLALLAGPAWATVQDSAVVFHPGSRDVGKANIRVTISDGQAQDTLDMSVTVLNVNDAPVAFPYANWQSPAHWKEHQLDTFTVVVVDMDKGDPITLATALPPFITYSFAVDSANAYNRFFRFTVAPRQQDSGTYNLKLHFTDKAGAASDLALVAKVQAVNDPPSALIKDNLVNAGAARISLDVSDSDGTLAQTRFHYRLIGPAGDTVKSGISASPILTLNPIADGNYTLAVKAEDEGGLKQSGFTTAAIKISGASTLTLDSALWNMNGTPGSALLASALGSGAAVSSWDETTDDGQALGRYASGKSADSLKRGKGYWIKVAKRVNLAIAQKDLLDHPFTLKLTHSKQGWNQIGNPFPYYVDLSATKLTFWEWDANRRDLVNAKGLLKPWGAYWVQVAKDTTLIIKDEPYFPGTSGALTKTSSLAPGFKSASDWSMQLALQAGPYQDQINYLGVRANSGAAVNHVADVGTADAPKFGDYIALHFDRPGEATDSLANDNGYSADFRDRLGADEEWWDFTVENSGSGFSQADLNLPGLEPLLASGLNVFLVRRGEAVALKVGEPAPLAMEGATTHYSLVVTPHADFAQRLQGNFNISQNFPNPVMNQTTFRFFLPQTWDASGKRESKAFRLRLNLYDYSGRLAAQVVQGDFKAGSHTLIWKPRAKDGRDLAKGAYIYRLEIPGFTQSLKLLIK